MNERQMTVHRSSFTVHRSEEYGAFAYAYDKALGDRFFRAVRRLMGPDSLLLFDMNHPDIYPAVWGMRDPFVASGPDYRLEIATTWRKQEGVGRALVTGWAVLADGARIEIRETHEQRAYGEREIVDALSEAGLVPVEVVDFDPYDEAGTVDAAG